MQNDGSVISIGGLIGLMVEEKEDISKIDLTSL
jgi:hypothetical protein